MNPVFRRYAPAFVRFGVAIVFFLFGILQLIHPEEWILWIPGFMLDYINPVTFIYINGGFDIVIGGLLLLGLLTRTAAFFGILHLVSVILSVGFTDTGIRDFGLLLALVSVLLQGSDDFCLDRKFK
ncbi:MAG: hypothetical protein RL557_54 [archaeon]|jgi:uncharacterized membrane protein YphA (DoxX/SURF4 family)